MKFDAFILEWKLHCRIKIGEGWRLCQDQIIKDHIAPYLGRQNVSRINPGHISEVLNQSRLRGHSQNTQKKIYMVLSKIFGDAVEFFEIIDTSPVRKRFHLPAVHAIEQPYLTLEESNILLEYVYDDPLWGPPIWTQLLAGPRVSEIQVLTYKDFIWRDGYIKITKAFNRHTKAIQAYTKNRGHHEAPLPPRLIKYLKERIPKDGFALPGIGGKMLASKTYDENLKRIFERLKFKITSSHGLRHSCATYYRSMGATDEQVKQLLGHKTIQSTQTYLHGTNKEIFEIAKKIA